MRRLFARRRLLVIWCAGGTLFLSGGCPLSDQQLTSVLQSVISTGLNTVVTQGLTTLVSGSTPTTP